MSERYKRLFALPKHLYADGSPLLIEAGALLKDSQTGRILAQIKFKSISPKIIKAVKISIGAFDISGVKLRGIDEYQYLDLSASRDSEFGQKNAVELPESITRSFSCECKSVVFYDGTTWESKGAEWKPLAQAQTLKEKLGALCEQYRRDTVDYADLVLTDDRDLWICTCGAINKKDEKCCHSCHVNKKILTDALDVKKLEENEAALKKAEAERKAEIERQELEKKKRAEEKKRQYIKIAKKITIISLPIVCVVVAFVIILNTIIIPNINYNNAVELMEDGKYSEAVVAFEAADGYEDSANMINECKDKLIKLLRKHTLACGYNNSFGLMDNGEVKATGNNNNDQCNVDSWKNIIQLAAGGSHTVGLKSDGTVVAVGNNSFGPCEVADWSDIIQIAAGGSHTVGLKSDKTVIALGRDDCGQCNVKGLLRRAIPIR